MKSLSWDKKKIYICIAYLFASILYFGRYFEYFMTGYNTSLFVMSYKYGFISRGFIGSVWAFLDNILPISLMSYSAVYYFSVLMTVFYLILQLYFILICLDKCQDDLVWQLALLLMVFVMPMYIGSQMLGRLDLYLYILSLISLILLLKEKWEWLICPLGIISVLIHQGMVFTNANLVLLPLAYKYLKTEDKKQKHKYLVIGLTYLISISVLFLYFEFFSHANGAEFYDELVANAKAMSYDGQSYNTSLFAHEILGQDVFDAEAQYRAYNRIEFPTSLILFAPYIYITIHFFYRLLKGKRGVELLTYTCIPLGAITILPEMLLKVDYGRYAFGTIYYILTMLIFMMAKGEGQIIHCLHEEKDYIKSWNPLPYSLLFYPALLIPFWDNIMSIEILKLARWIFG